MSLLLRNSFQKRKKAGKKKDSSQIFIQFETRERKEGRKERRKMAPKPSTTTVTQRVNVKGAERDANENLMAKQPKKQLSLWGTFVELFFHLERFAIHRVTGLLYLVQFFTALYLMTFDYETFQKTPLAWSLPLTGWLQAIIASRTFTFLPKGNDAQGYYSDKRTITYSFLLENIYFSGLLLFQSLYCFTDFFQNVPLPHEKVRTGLELILVFLPYTLIRTWFPKTSLGDSREDDGQYTDKNKRFLKAISLTSKVFYVWAKHFNGYYLNYMVFLGMVKDSPTAIYRTNWLLLAGGWATTVAMFLNTLKFKKIIGPKLALSLYAGTFPVIVTVLTLLQYQYRSQLWVAYIVMLGVPVNFLPRNWYAQHIYQFIVMAYMYKFKNKFDSQGIQ